MAPKVQDPKKLLKIVNCQKAVLSHLEKVGGHQYPPESIFIHMYSPSSTSRFSFMNNGNRNEQC